VIVRGSLVLLSPKVCHHLQRPLWEAVERARREGLTLPADVAEAVRDIAQLAEEYRRQAVGSDDIGTDQARRPAPVPTDGTGDAGNEPVVRSMTAMEIADMTGLTARGVTKAAGAGRLVGQRVHGRWRFDATDVAVWVQARQS
jgi:hypothetical protein